MPLTKQKVTDRDYISWLEKHSVELACDVKKYYDEKETLRLRVRDLEHKLNTLIQTSAGRN